MPAVKQLQLRRPDGSFGPWLDVEPGLDTFRDRLRGDDPFQVRFDDHEFGLRHRLPGTMERVAELVENHEHGKIRVKTRKGQILALRLGSWFTERVPPPPSNVSPAIRQCHEFVFSRTEELELDRRQELRVVTMGYTVNKWINGTVGGTPSQHCEGPPEPDGGNAFDWVIRGGDGENDIPATDVVVVELERKPFCSECLWRGVADHFPGHAHASGDPKRIGVPEVLR